MLTTIKALTGKLKQMREKNKKLRKLRKQLADRDRELERLRARFGLARDDARRPNFPLQGTPVFFIVGRAKSGTSWLMRILDAHPEILCKGEGRFFGRDFIQENFKRGQQGRIQPSSLYRALLEAEYLEAWIERSVWTRGDDVKEHVNNLTRLSTDYFLTQRFSESSEKIVGDKTTFLGANVIVDEIGEIYPEAKVIHIIRDGRDVAVSLLHHRWNYAKDEGGIYELRSEELTKRDTYRKDPQELILSGEGLFPRGMLEGLAAGWREQITKSRNYGLALLGDNYSEVRYEGLLERPAEEIVRILRFLGADASEETVRHCIEMGSFERWTKGRKRGQEDSSSFFRKGVAGDWKNVFIEEDKQIFKEVAGDLLIRLGYEKDDNW